MAFFFKIIYHHHDFDLPSLFIFNQLFNSQFKMLTKLSFLFTKKIPAYYNLLLLAYSKEKKRAATLLYYTQREKKKPA